MIYIRFQTFNYFKTPLPPQNEENVSLNANKWKIKYELIGSNMTTENEEKASWKNQNWFGLKYKYIVNIFKWKLILKKLAFPLHGSSSSLDYALILCLSINRNKYHDYRRDLFKRYIVCPDLESHSVYFYIKMYTFPASMHGLFFQLCHELLSRK